MLEPLELRAAVDDLKKHTLASLHGDVARLVYLAGTRDYNSGKYYHDGLAARFTQEISGRALAECHQQVFQRIVEAPLGDLVSCLEEYIRSDCPGDGVLNTWLTLEPYRVIIPMSCDPLAAKLFCSNFMIALVILEHRARSRSKN